MSHSTPAPDPEPGVELRRHPPERRPTPSVMLPQFGCCCCCCCCLHSLGGLIGGIVGSVGKITQEPKPVDPDFPFPFRRDELENEPDLLPVAALYWILVLFIIGCVAICWALMDGRTDSAFVGILIALFFFPAVQLGASVLALLGVSVLYTDRNNALRRLGQITVLSVLGGVIGAAVEAGVCGMFLIR